MLKQALLVAGALSLTTSAFALEVTNPFYGPEKGHVASTTSYDYSTTTKKSNWYVGDHTRVKAYDQALTEALSYGVSDSVSIDASVANTWHKDKTVHQTSHVTDYMHTDTEDKNIDFTVGATWNVLTGPTKVQVKGLYGQRESTPNDAGAYKYVAGSVKAGHTYGIYTPYIQGGVEVPVATGNGHVGNDHEKYSARAAVYSYCPRSKVAIDTGISFDYDRETSAHTVGYDLEVSYFLTDNVAVSATAGYILAGHEEHNTDIKGENVGLKLRVAF